MAPPFRADHVGSLLRPQSLLNSQSASAAGLYGRLRGIYSNPADPVAVSQAIEWVVKEQLARNIRPITSGEYDRAIFYGGMFENLLGMEVRLLPILEAYRTKFPTSSVLASMGVKERPAVVCTGKIRYVQSAYLREWEMMTRGLAREHWDDCKITIPSPTYQHMQLKSGTAYTLEAYPSDEEYFADLSAAYRSEIKALYDAGVRHIQVDDPNLTFFCFDGFLEGCREDGVDVDALLNLYVQAHNDCLRDRPKDLHVGVHLCRGNFAGSTYFATGTYEPIAQKLFNGLDYDTFLLEYDSPRAGGLEPLRYLPRDKNVVLGVVSTKSPDMEDLETLRERVLQAADVIAEGHGRSREEALRQIAVSPQCGFSSAASGGGKGVTMEVMWGKLALVQKLAESIRTP